MRLEELKVYQMAMVFLYYARGAAHETLTWITKAGQRNLISRQEEEQILNKTNECLSMLNGLIKRIGNIPPPHSRQMTPDS